MLVRGSGRRLRLMATVERHIDRTPEWAAVNHHDLDRPHAHVVVHTGDRDGGPEPRNNGS
jgi:type IV secretory pathway VirD2 relaxase